VLYDRQLGYAVGAPDVLSLVRVVSSKKLQTPKPGSTIFREIDFSVSSRQKKFKEK